MTLFAALLFSAVSFSKTYAQTQVQGQVQGQVQTQAQGGLSETYHVNEIVRAGHGFFGEVSKGLASLIERAASQYGLPNGYILGQEASGAFIAGLRYGEGQLYTKNAGDHPVFWQGPSVGFDFGGDGSRTMILVYNLPTIPAIYRRHIGIDGSAYIVGGLGMTALINNPVIIVPIRTGVGGRLGVNIGYLKMLPRPTWNPF